MPDDLFAELLSREALPGAARHSPPPDEAMAALVTQAAAHPRLVAADPRQTIEAINAEIDRKLTEQINLILHHPEFQALEASWRGLQYLVLNTDSDATLKIRALDIGKRELARTLRKFRGTAWDQSPVFRKVYEEEYGQLGGEPFGALIGDYTFDHSPPDVQLLADMAQIAAAAHAPFLAGVSPSILQMTDWSELANPRDITKIFGTPEYAPWRSLRESEDSRYIGLAMPRFLARLPYGARTEPVDAFAFEEDAEGPDASTYVWANAAYAMGTNLTKAFKLYGWTTRIRGVGSGGAVEGLPTHTFPTADGAVDLKCVTEIALSERREAELARSGFMPLVHRKNQDFATFVSAQSLQKPQEYDDPAATANANLSACLPYLFASCRFAHYLKCMVRDKIGATLNKTELASWLQRWLDRYVDGSPNTSSEEFKAAHPLAEGKVVLEDREGAPGQYDARFYLQPHYQLEGLSVALRLASRLSSA